MEMELAVKVFTEINSTIKTLRISTQKSDSYQWPMLEKIQMGHNSLSQQV